MYLGQRPALYGLFLHCLLRSDDWGTFPSLSKLDYKTTPQSLSLILENDTCSGQYLTDLWLSIKVVIHSKNKNPLGPCYNSSHHTVECGIRQDSLASQSREF